MYWTGVIDGQFSPWEECRDCVAAGWGMPWLRKYWEQEGGAGAGIEQADA